MTAVATYLMNERIPLARKKSLSEDTALLARCRAQDASAFRELYRQNRTRVFCVISRMVTNNADREEITQEVFLQIFRSLKNFKGTAKLSTWIHRITINVTLQYIRRKRSRIRLHMDSDVGERTQPDKVALDSPEDRAIQGEQRKAVERALAALSPKKRAVLVLADFEGMKAAQIAKIVGAPVLTVRTRLFYARRDFYQHLENEPACADLDIGQGGQG